MPYRNIVWIKLEKRLLGDYRWYSMSNDSQLIYIKLLLLAAETNNKVPQSWSVLRSIFRLAISEERFKECLREIEANFPKLKKVKGLYKIGEFMKKHNRVVPRTAQDTPEDNVDKRRRDKIRKEYVSIKGFDLKHLFKEDYARMGKAIKGLLARSGGNADLVCEGLNWIKTQPYSWTLETLNKKWVDFMSQKGAKKYL